MGDKEKRGIWSRLHFRIALEELLGFKLCVHCTESVISKAGIPKLGLRMVLIVRNTEH